MAIRFYLSPRPDKYGECPIRTSISIRGTRLISTAGYNIHPDKWNKVEQRVKKGHYNADKVPANIINARLKSIDSHFSNFEIGLDHRPTPSELAEQLATIKGSRPRTQKKDKEQSVIGSFDRFIMEESRLNQWTEGTMQCWRAFRKHLDSMHYCELSEINENGIARFVDYLRQGLKMNDTTAEKHYSNLMWFLGWCARKGLCSGESIHKYKPKFKIIPPPVIFLTRSELLYLYNFPIPANGAAIKLHNLEGKEYERIVTDAAALEKTRDLFCFCAFTGLRYSDMAKLKRSDVFGDAIHIVTKKTDDSLIIELNDYSRAILEKYNDKDFANGLALPVISNQRMNDYIKILGELCEFNTPITKSAFIGGQRQDFTRPKWEFLGTHAGRRTFICFALSQGIPPQVVMKWTGHSDYKAMKPYIDIATDTKQKAMQDFNKGMEE